MILGLHARCWINFRNRIYFFLNSHVHFIPCTYRLDYQPSLKSILSSRFHFLHCTAGNRTHHVPGVLDKRNAVRNSHYWLYWHSLKQLVHANVNSQFFCWFESKNVNIRVGLLHDNVDIRQFEPANISRKLLDFFHYLQSILIAPELDTNNSCYTYSN